MFLFQNSDISFQFFILIISSSSKVFQTSGAANENSCQQLSEFLSGKEHLVDLSQFLKHYINGDNTFRERDFTQFQFYCIQQHMNLNGISYDLQSYYLPKVFKFTL